MSNACANSDSPKREFALNARRGKCIYPGGQAVGAWEEAWPEGVLLCRGEHCTLSSKVLKYVVCWNITFYSVTSVVCVIQYVMCLIFNVWCLICIKFCFKLYFQYKLWYGNGI